MQSGHVTDLGFRAAFNRTPSESWATWGIAESDGVNDYMTYVQDPHTIVRQNVATGAVTTVANFSNLADMANFTVDSVLNRWYFHYEGTGQFRSGDETLGFADATFSITSSATPEPGSLTMLGLGALGMAGYSFRRRRLAAVPAS